MNALLIGGLGTTELVLILAVIILLFGAAKLPDLARSTGRSLRIFKAETKGLMDDDDEKESPERTATLPSSTPTSATAEQVDPAETRRTDPA